LNALFASTATQAAQNEPSARVANVRQAPGAIDTPAEVVVHEKGLGLLKASHWAQQYRMVRKHEARWLSFSPGHEADAHAMTLPPNIPIMLDVLVLTEKTKVLVTMKEPYTLERRVEKTPVFAETGTDVFSIVVSGQTGGKRGEKPVFEWTRDWDTSTLRLAGK